MNFTVYVSEELARRIKEAKDLKLSRIFQRAVKKELKRRDSNKEKQT